MKRLFSILIALTVTLSAARGFAAPLIAIAGDSMAAEFYSGDIRGWGMELPQLFSTDISVLNEARSGSSTSSFLNGSAVVDGVDGVHHWANILAAKPDYILISFGWNDKGAPDGRRCTLDQYKANLTKMAQDAQAIGAKPLFITTPTNRDFFPDGSVNNSIRSYADAMIAVANEQSAPVFDFNASIVSIYQTLGPIEAPSYGYSDSDILHFGEYGAKEASSFIAQNLVQAFPELDQYALQVPEPSALAFLGTAAIGFVFFWRKFNAS